MSLFERLKEQDDREKWDRQQGNIKLEKEYKFRDRDGEIHTLVPVQTYNNGQIYGVIVDGEKYALISAKYLKDLIYKNKELNRDPQDVKVEHDKTVNKQEKEKDKDKDIQYVTITVYDMSDDGDHSDSKSISAMMDSRGNVFTSNGTKFYRVNAELNLDLENDTGKFYHDYLNAHGEPVDLDDMLERGIDPDVIKEISQLSSEQDAYVQENINEGLSLKEMRESYNKETFTTDDHETTYEDIELEEKDIRYE